MKDDTKINKMAGDNKKPTHRKHSQFHDYTSRCIYHITMVVRDRCKVLATITGDSVEDAFSELTDLGHDVSRCIQAIPAFQARNGRRMKILSKSVMPTHIHFVLFVEEPMNCPLGSIIHGFKIGCNQALRKYLEGEQGKGEQGEAEQGKGGQGKGEQGEAEQGKADLIKAGEHDGKQENAAACQQGSAACQQANAAACQQGSPAAWQRNYLSFPLPADVLERHQFLKLASRSMIDERSLFEPDYDETILTRQGQLRNMIDYVHDNPRRKWVKMHQKDRFIPMRHIHIAGHDYDAIGDIMLLGLPRFQCHVRSFWNDEEKRQHKNTCVKKARLGYAIVSPFISEHESEVEHFILQEGHSIIKLVDNGFSDFTTCPGDLFEYCQQGQVLLLVPSELPHIDKKRRISRQECIFLNERARLICEE